MSKELGSIVTCADDGNGILKAACEIVKMASDPQSGRQRHKNEAQKSDAGGKCSTHSEKNE